ncbi:MAG: AI-2E family transporter [Erysipelotrichaceae bacterium]|nr:AI-2E family transporter [Erysipelotrichaceae bacterium]
MRFDLKNEVQRKIFINSVSLIIAIVAFLVLFKIRPILEFIKGIIGILLPFILGFGLAFLLDGPINWLDNRLSHRTRLPKAKCRGVSVFLIFLAALLFVAALLTVLIPSLAESIKVFIENFSEYSARTEAFILVYAEKYHLDIAQIKDFFENLNLPDLLHSLFPSAMSKAMSYSYSVVRGVTLTLIAIASAVYMSLDKENLLHLIKSLTYSVLPTHTANFLTLYTMDAKNVFQQYIVGNILDSFIVGVVCWLGMIVLNVPYAPMIGFIVGVTNVIPVFGPFLGAIPVILLLLVIDPFHALVFAVFILILQQIDGNVLKPIILGDKLGISGFWILFSVTVGGSLFGVTGMFLGVPVFALVYEAIQDLIAIRLHNKKITVPDEAGVIT